MLRQVRPGALNQCKHVTASKECVYAVKEGYEYCEQHIHRYDSRFQNPNTVKSVKAGAYHLRANHAAVQRHMNAPESKTLEVELAILQQSLETLLNLCDTELELLMYLPRVESIINSLAKIKSTSTRLNMIQGRSLDETNAKTMIDEIISIISSEIQDSAVLERIANKIGEALEKARERSVIAADARSES